MVISILMLYAQSARASARGARVPAYGSRVLRRAWAAFPLPAARHMRWGGAVLSLVGGAVAAAALVPRVGPPAPAGLVCETAKSTSTSIALRWDRVVGADFYDLQCSGAGSQIFTKPFVSVGGPGTAGTVVSLLPNTTLTCQVRAHRFAATGFYHHNTLVGDWSELSAAKVQCATLAGTPLAAARTLTVALKPRRWPKDSNGTDVASQRVQLHD